MEVHSHKAPKGRKNTGGGDNPRTRVVRKLNPERVAEYTVAPSGLWVFCHSYRGLTPPPVFLCPFGAIMSRLTDVTLTGIKP